MISFRHPLKWIWFIMIVSLFFSIWKIWVPKPFVKMFVVWSSVEICLEVRLLCKTFSQTKWKSISICFILERIIGFAAKKKNVAPKLSHHRIREEYWIIPISLSKDWVHESSTMTNVIVMHSNFVVEQTMISYLVVC